MSWLLKHAVPIEQLYEWKNILDQLEICPGDIWILSAGTTVYVAIGGKGVGRVVYMSLLLSPNAG